MDKDKDREASEQPPEPTQLIALGAAEQTSSMRTTPIGERGCQDGERERESSE